jgi:hypothetical protein
MRYQVVFGMETLHFEFDNENRDGRQRRRGMDVI